MEGIFLGSLSCRPHLLLAADDVAVVHTPADVIYLDCESAHTTFVNVSLLHTLLRNFLRHLFYSLLDSHPCLPSCMDESTDPDWEDLPGFRSISLQPGQSESSCVSLIHNPSNRTDTLHTLLQSEEVPHIRGTLLSERSKRIRSG
jgi:hypothetical protein